MQDAPPGSQAAPSLAGRAALAVSLMIGFYGLAIVIAGSLVVAGVLLLTQERRVPGNAHLALFLVGSGVSILWAILPRFDRFVAPGPELARADHPRLFQRIEKIALATGQEMPESVYLVPDVNAWVSRRGGFMGFGSRPILGLGLPLLATMSTAEVEAVLAHEFGHFHGGETKLGPWIHKTRAAIGRTIAMLQQRRRSYLRLPFVLYGNLFLRLTHAVSRRQEYAADALAAKMVGARPLASGLRRIQAVAMAYDAFLQQEIGPAVAAGYRLPMAEGFFRFVGAAPVAASLERAVEARSRESTASAYDTHPPLRDRLAALGPLPDEVPGEQSGRAIELIERVADVEERLLGWMIRGKPAANLRPLAWEAAGATVWVPSWRRFCAENAAVLRERTPETLPTTRADLLAVGHEIARSQPARDEATFLREANGLLGSALVLALLDSGWSLTADPGAEVEVTKGDARIRPFTVVTELAAGRLAKAEWLDACSRTGIGSLPLEPAAPPIASVDGARSSAG